ncbi:Dcm methylase [Salmonella enterica subsp. enterica serovar Corvallis]|nr:Dcm methylase [Salmonella enterica subsp. enterica serovar Corvallis]
MLKKAIFLFDYTGIMAAPWLAGGYECWLFDGQHKPGVHRDPVNPRLVRVGMWFEAFKRGQATEIARMVGAGVVFVASFAECTDLTCTGARWWPEKRAADPEFQEKAADLAMLAHRVARRCWWVNGFLRPSVAWMLENPAISRLNTMWRRPDHKFHPYEYGGYLPEDDKHPLYPEVYPPRDGYNKLTGIWCGGPFVMPEQRPVEGVKHNPGWKHCGGKSLRTKNIRSITPRGFAQAVFEANK